MLYALPPLAAESIFNIGTFSVTNTYINSTLTVILFVILAFFVKRSIKEVPTGIQNFFEFIIETLLTYFDQVTGDRKKSLKFLPLIGTLFLFIVVSNWIGLLPGVGSVGIHRGAEFIPLFRGANTDLNLTLAMAVFGVIASHVIGIGTIGFWRYFNKFIKAGDIVKSFKSKNFMIVFTAFIEFGVGLIEIVSEIAKLFSLSLRLFGNVFAGEVLLTVLGSIIAYAVPLPFIALELLVGLIQATVFSLLVLVYISVATMPLPDHGHNDKKKHGHDLEPAHN
ncbi:MAG: synthase subunit F-type H+-transporting ATPase subunit a [Candidatus Doudnabacteria bacterium]|nr:synthase subunit F-type H+-transporting ATPase subunit a [Candidatus Doudnabacteria bacterium]